MEMEQMLVMEDEFGVSDYSDDESIDESIKASIERIRKEASRMDLYIALDQIDSLQQENGIVKSALRDREAELTIMKEKVSSLTMERDLLQVDTNNLKEDMTTLVDKMFEISCVAGNSSLPDSNLSTVDDDDNLSQVVETDSVLPDVMIFDEHYNDSFPPNSSQVGEGMPVPRSKNIDDMMKITSETQSNSISMELTCSGCSVTTRTNRDIPGSSSLPGCQHVKRRCFVPSPCKKKLDGAPHAYTLRPVERKRTIFGRFFRWLTSCSRSKQVADMQDQLNQLQSMIQLSIATTEQLQMRMEYANQDGLDDSP